MTNNNLKTFSELLIKDKKTTAELADLIEKIGVYCLDGPGRWKLVKPSQNNKDLLPALNCLTEYRHIKDNSTLAKADEYWKAPEQPIDNFALKDDGDDLYTEHKGEKEFASNNRYDDKRAIALHFWLSSDNQLGERAKTWQRLSEIDAKLFQPNKSVNSAKVAMDRVTKRYKEIYKTELSFTRESSK